MSPKYDFHKEVNKIEQFLHAQKDFSRVMCVQDNCNIDQHLYEGT
jgi:hypothetical protein